MGRAQYREGCSGVAGSYLRLGKASGLSDHAAGRRAIFRAQIRARPMVDDKIYFFTGQVNLLISRAQS